MTSRRPNTHSRPMSRFPLIITTAALLVLLVTPIALAGAAVNGPQARHSSRVEKKKKPKRHSSIKAQLKALKARVAALERAGSPPGRPGPGATGSAPTGPAGGALSGSYPNPRLGEAAVRGNNLAPGSVTTGKLAPRAVTEGKLAAGSVGTTALIDRSVTTAKLGANAVLEGNLGAGSVGSKELINGSVGTDQLALGAVNGGKLAPGSVGAATFADTFPVQGPDQFVNAGHTEETSVSCPVGSRLLSGGAEWSPSSDDNTAIISSSPSFSGDPSRTWVVQGRVDTGGAARDHLFAEALCLDL
jgi:hypothetical protein